MRTFMLSAALAALAGVPAQAETVNYWAVQLGSNTVRDWNAKVDFGFGTPVAGRADLDRGLHGGLALGRQSQHLRYELEYQQGRFDIERLTLGAVSQAVDASGRYQALMGNAYRTDRLSQSVDSFIGAGIGWGRVRLPRLALSASCDCFGPASDKGFAWQLRAGLAYRLSPTAALSLQLTRMDLPSPQRGGAPGVAYEDRHFNTVTLGYARQY
jgi:opacity protein-like surface antigen